MSNEKIVLARKPVEGCNYLNIVLCKWGNEFVTWMENTELGGYNHGHYYTDLLEAVEDYKARD